MRRYPCERCGAWGVANYILMPVKGGGWENKLVCTGCRIEYQAILKRHGKPVAPATTKRASAQLTLSLESLQPGGTS